MLIWRKDKVEATATSFSGSWETSGVVGDWDCSPQPATVAIRMAASTGLACFMDSPGSEKCLCRATGDGGLGTVLSAGQAPVKWRGGGRNLPSPQQIQSVCCPVRQTIPTLRCRLHRPCSPDGASGRCPTRRRDPCVHYRSLQLSPE